MFKNSYLPDRLDVNDTESIAYFDFIESQKYQVETNLLKKLINFLFK